MAELPLVIEGVPVPAARPRVFRNGGVSYPASHLKHKAHLEKVLPPYAPLCPKAPVMVFFQFIMPRYKASDALAHRADLDNLEKLPLDCMTTAGFWDDDYLVVAKITSKRFAQEGESPCTRVRVVDVSNPDELSEKLFNL